MTYNDTLDYKAGMKEFAILMNPRYLLTLEFNQPGETSYQYANDCVRRYHARLDRELLGPKWSRIHTNQRSHSITWFQGNNVSARLNSEATALINLHAHHMLAPCPYPRMPMSDRQMQLLTRECWKDVVPSGNTFFDLVWEPGGASDYCGRLVVGTLGTSLGIGSYSVN